MYIYNIQTDSSKPVKWEGKYTYVKTFKIQLISRLILSKYHQQCQYCYQNKWETGIGCWILDYYAIYDFSHFVSATIIYGCQTETNSVSGVENLKLKW